MKLLRISCLFHVTFVIAMTLDNLSLLSIQIIDCIYLIYHCTNWWSLSLKLWPGFHDLISTRNKRLLLCCAAYAVQRPLQRKTRACGHGLVSIPFNLSVIQARLLLQVAMVNECGILEVICAQECVQLQYYKLARWPEDMETCSTNGWSRWKQIS